MLCVYVVASAAFRGTVVFHPKANVTVGLGGQPD